MAGLAPPRVPAKLVPVFTPAELSKLERACAGRSFAQRRDTTVIAVLTATGIRLSELAGPRYDPRRPAVQRRQVGLDKRGDKLSCPGRCLTWQVQAVCARSSVSFSDRAMNPKVLRGLPLRLAAMRARSPAECTDRSVPLGRYWRSSPLVFSFEPRCQGECGLQK
jgi:integrase